jgi:tol-pal system protein YbgF
MTKVSGQDSAVSDVCHARVRWPSFAAPKASLMRGAAVMAVAVGMSLPAISVPAFAQQTPGSPQRPTVTAQKSAPKAAPKAETPAPAANENTLRQRVEQLEEQLVEMQVTVGTLDSLAKGGGNSSSGVYRGSNDAPAGGGADAGKVAALETQVRALATQVDQLTQQIRQLNSRPQSAAAPTVAGPAVVPLAAPVTPAPAAGGNDPIGALVGNANTGGSSAPAQSIAQAGASDASSKQAYETAYGFLLQQDYGAAETAFDDFLKRFPSDPLAGNAQYWLGETFFARGQYKPAAGAFLKGYQTYARSAKAPDSVLKLAMSLDKLGQKDAACASYSELTTKFPNAPGHVKNRADTERRRLGCA